MQKHFQVFLSNTWNAEKDKDNWNEIAKVRLHQTSLSCVKTFTFFSNKCQCQPTKIPSLNP